MKNFNNDFEQFLRESIDDFKMMPARKIWHGIYNNIHPDRKWPSLAVGLMMLVAILFVGVSNNNSINHYSKNNISYSATLHTEESMVANTESEIEKVPQVIANQLMQPLIVIASSSRELHKVETNENIYSLVNDNISFITSKTKAVKNDQNFFSNYEDKKSNSSNSLAQDYSIESNIELGNNNKLFTDKISEIKKDIVQVKIINEEAAIQKNDKNNSFEKLTEKSKTKEQIEKSVVKNEVPKSMLLKNKILNNGTLQYYITASRGYRELHLNQNSSTNNTGFNTLLPTAAGALQENVMEDIGALNLEMGASLRYKTSKRIFLKAGVQVNYTNYVSKVTNIGHTVEAVLATNSSRNNVSSSLYSTKIGNDRINNSTVQVALPLGADVQLISNRNVKWFIGATLQPTYVIGGSGFVLSNDSKNYIAEKSLIRRFNLNTSLETYLTINTAKGIALNVGPQFRYQLLSSYKNTYNHKERLYNVGIKIGVTKNL
jgi:hypothetical protein